MSQKPTILRVAVAAVAPLVVALGILGGIGSFATIRHLAQPWFGPSAWIVPVGIDLGIAALLAWDLLAEYAALPWPVLRWTAWAFIAATVYLNITAARGDLDAAVMHAAMPTLFVIVIEGVRHLIRQVVGLAAGTRIERIPASRWLLAPRSSFLLFRHMVLWHVTSYRTGLALEYQRWQAIARLQQQHGRYMWRWRAPLSERLALRPAPVEVSTATSEPDAAVDDHDRRLIEAASAILQEARGKGLGVSQAKIGRLLREQGLPIANERLRWLIATADGCGGLSVGRASPQERGPDP